jgi:integrase
VAYIDGKHRWFSGFETKGDAERKLTEVLGEADKGLWVSPSKVPLEVFLGGWLEARKSQLRPTTLGNYERDVRLHIVPFLGATKLARLTPEQINRLYGHLLDSGLSPRAVQHVHVVLGRALEDAVRWGKLARNPARFADAPKPQRRDMQTWTAGELSQFLGWCRDNKSNYVCASHFVAYLLSATTGMRRGEVLGLRWKDLDLNGARVTISRSLIGNRGRHYFSPPKTRAGLRTISLDAETLTTLKEHRLATMSQELVFSEDDGRPLNPNAFSASFQDAIKLAGLPRIRFHDLRHTFATLALQAGVNPRTVQERLGHSNVAITLGIYTHVTERDERGAAVKVAESIFGGEWRSIST